MGENDAEESDALLRDELEVNPNPLVQENIIQDFELRGRIRDDVVARIEAEQGAPINEN